MAFRNRVETTCALVKSEIYGKNGGPVARNNVRNYAVTIGADTVIWTEYNDSPDRVSHADFYRCRAVPTPTP